MAVAISNGNVNINTASGFDQAEQYNLGMFSGTKLALSSTRQINFTPTTTRNSKGVILCLNASATTVDRSVQVQLRNGTTVLQTATLTANQIKNSVTSALTGDWIVYFDYTDEPLTASTVYNFSITQTGGTTGNWQLRTSDATNPFYVEVPNKAYTFVNDDCLIVKPGDQVTINASFSVKGVLPTGDTASGVAGIIGKSSAAITTSSLNEGLIWAASPAASYTMTVDGMVVLGAHSGFRIGSSGSPIPFAQQAIVSFSNRTVGTTASGWYGTEGTLSGAVTDKGWSMFMYGAVPAVPYVTLSANYAAGTTSIVSNQTPTSWANGDRIYVGKQNVAGTGAQTLNTLTGAPVGTTIPITALATNQRMSGGRVVNLERYGVKVISNTTNRALSLFQGPSNFKFSGVAFEEARFRLAWTAAANQTPLDDAANTSQWEFTDIMFYSSGGSGNNILITLMNPPPKGVLVTRFNGVLTVFTSASHVNNISGPLEIRNSFMSSATLAGQNLVTNSIADSNILEHSNGTALTLGGTNITHTNNQIWGNSIGVGFNSGFISAAAISGNVYDKNATAMRFLVSCDIGTAIDTNSTFGQTLANTADIRVDAGLYVKYNITSQTGSPAVSSSTFQYEWLSGTKLRFSEYNDTVNDYRAYYQYGNFLNNSSNLELYSNTGSAELSSRIKIGTETISGATLSLATTANISNAAYYAGTYVLPKMRLTYDGTSTSTATATATTGAQNLAVSVTPGASSNNSLIYVDLTAQTDAATDANRKVTFTPVTLLLLKYGYNIQTITLPIKETTDDKVTIVTTPVVNPFITLTSVQAAALSSKFTYAGGTFTWTDNGTVSEAYQYGQYLKITTPSITTPFDTIDGVNFTANCNVVINSGKAATGGGSITITGYTFTETGTYNGTIIDGSSVKPLLTAPNLTSGSRIQFYNTTTSTEIYNTTLATAGYRNRITLGSGFSAGDTVRLRATYATSSAAMDELEVSSVMTSTGLSFIDSQTTMAEYATWGIDGSSVTEFSADYPNVQIDLSDPDGTTTRQRLMAWWVYNLTTSSGISNFFGGIVIEDVENYKTVTSILDLHLDNVSGTPVKFSDTARLYRDDGTTIIAATSGSIHSDSGKVYEASGGSSASDVATAVWADTTTYGSGTKGKALKDASKAKLLL